MIKRLRAFWESTTPRDPELLYGTRATRVATLAMIKQARKEQK